MVECVVLVDAGFLRAEGARALGVSTGKIRPNASACVAHFRAMAASEGAELLRLYWYDAAFDADHPQYWTQRSALDAIAGCPGIQLRLGHIREDMPSWHYALKAAVVACGIPLADFERHFQFRPQRQQKGVDTLIVLDMVRLAQRGAYDTAILLAGDRDLAPAVAVAQDEGKRVFITHPVGGGVAKELRQLGDKVLPISKVELKSLLSVAAP